MFLTLVSTLSPQQLHVYSDVVPTWVDGLDVGAEPALVNADDVAAFLVFVFVIAVLVVV
jgi:hypothetical protein